MIASGRVFVAESGDEELDGLFVEPDRWKQGIGRLLVEHCAGFACTVGATAPHVVGNPHAESFYAACGFEIIGVSETRFGVGLLMQRNVVEFQPRRLLRSSVVIATVLPQLAPSCGAVMNEEISCHPR